MKKLLLTILTSACILTASASSRVEFPYAFQTKVLSTNDLAGWTIFGPEGRPTGTFASYFKSYSAENPVIVGIGAENIGTSGVWSPCQYANDVVSDTWLITPLIHVDNEYEILSFTIKAAGINPSTTDKCNVYVSEGGTAKEDFKLLESITFTGVNGSGGTSAENMIVLNKPYVLLEGYAGKDIRIAVTNEGNTKGVMGFQDFVMAPWLPDYSNFKNVNGTVFSSKVENFVLNFNMKAVPPVRCSEYKYELTTSEGYTAEGTLTRGSSLSAPLRQTTVICNIRNIPFSGESLTYTLKITPVYDGAPSLVLNGGCAQASPEYESVAVMEDATGLWCGYCPFGTAGLALYSEKYNGENGARKAIGIGVHFQDILSINPAISDYRPAMEEDLYVDGFPSVYINRNLASLTPSPNPTIIGDAIEEVFAQKSFVNATLNNIYYQPEVSNEMIAKFDVTASVNTNSVPLNASIVVVEDNVEGTNMQYNQVSYLPRMGVTANWVTQNLGEEWLPYLEMYIGTENVMYNKIQYMDVARAVYPSFQGMELKGAAKGETSTLGLQFQMPENVNIKENTRAILLITNANTGEIWGADQLRYDQFTFESGVENVSADSSTISASVENGMLVVRSSERATVDVYTLDGSRVLRAQKAEGESRHAIDCASKILLVKVTSANSAKTFKVMK